MRRTMELVRHMMVELWNAAKTKSTAFRPTSSVISRPQDPDEGSAGTLHNVAHRTFQEHYGKGTLFRTRRDPPKCAELKRSCRAHLVEEVYLRLTLGHILLYRRGLMGRTCHVGSPHAIVDRDPNSNREQYDELERNE